MQNKISKIVKIFPFNLLFFIFKVLQKTLVFVLVKFIKFYQYFISPLFPPSCRYYPSCSSYAIQAIQIHGAFKGSYLAIKRILRCNPYCEGGNDPVPKKNK